jgi:nucleotide-binding universal stress UspA family protein
MYKKMLVVLDGSELAEIVFPYAKELAGRLDIDVILLHVYSQAMRGSMPMYKAYIESTAKNIGMQAQQIQQSLSTSKSAKPVEVRGELVMGYHADEILRFAEENAVNLIMMASHGRSGAQRWSIGSVADKILRAARVPVWLVHADAEKAVPYDQWHSRTLLVPLSGSDVSAIVIPHAIALAKQKGASMDVVLMQVVEPPITPSYYSPELTGMPLNWGQFVEQEIARSKKATQEYLTDVEKQFREVGINVSSLVLTGKPAEEIVAYAGKNPFTVVIMATHGRTGLSRLVYGSVAQSVLYGITNPMVLIGPQ